MFMPSMWLSSYLFWASRNLFLIYQVCNQEDFKTGRLNNATAFQNVAMI